MSLATNLTRNIILILALIFASLCKAEENSGQLLSTANEVRSANPEQLKTILGNIDTNILNVEQLDLFKYLSAYSLSMSGLLEEAVVEFEALISPETSTDIRYRAMASLVTMYTGLEDWSKALRTTESLLAVLEQVSSVEASEQTRTSIIVFYNHIGEYDLVKKFGKELLLNTKSLRTRCLTTSQIVYANLKSSPQNIIISDLNNAVDDCISADERILTHDAIANLAQYFIGTQQYSEAAQVLENNIADVKSNAYPPMTATYYKLMAKTYLLLESHTKAEYYSQLLIQTESEHQYAPAIKTAFDILSQVAEKNKDYAGAFFYLKKFSEAEQINLDRENAKLLAIQKAKFETVEQNNRIALLNKENDLLKIRLALDTKSTENNRLTIALLTLVLILIFLWAYKTKLNQTKLRHMAETDELTGISNRHHFNQLAKTAIKYCFSNNQPLSFILFDLDHFKKINDSFGHQVGDWALQNAVKAASTMCRNNDVIGRVGGEEFGILLPGCSIQKAEQLAEDCRQALEALDSLESGYAFKITASFGVADVKTCGYDFFKLFAGADAALYQSKDEGRNQVLLYEPDKLVINLQSH